MRQVFMEGGPMMFPIALCLLVLLGLALRTALALRRRRAAGAAVVQNGLDGLLFWGVLAIVLGALGQVAGYYKAMSYVVAKGLASPRALWIGIAEGFVSTIAGLGVLALAGVLWYLLRWQHLRSGPVSG